VADTVTPLCSPAEFTGSAYGDLVKDYSPQRILGVLQESTRMCEDYAGRRLAPFTITETHRAEGMDPDEYADSANMPMDIYGSLGVSYAQALGATSLVRHCWLSNYPVRHPELWSYSDVSLQIIRSYGGSQAIQPAQILDGPDDTGHIWFQLGLYLPVGSRVRATYSGGYSDAPLSLVRANKMMAAFLVIRELDPEDTAHDPDLLREDAEEILNNWRT
jgi:hypothetical protein